MGDLIDRQAFIRKMQKTATEAWKMNVQARVETVWNECIDLAKQMPTVEPERKRGRWIDIKGRYYRCSECGADTETIAVDNGYVKFCRWCGARMDGAE